LILKSLKSLSILASLMNLNIWNPPSPSPSLVHPPALNEHQKVPFCIRSTLSRGKPAATSIQNHPLVYLALIATRSNTSSPRSSS